MAPAQAESGVLGWIHERMYPKRSKYFWYRKGKVDTKSLGRKYVNFVVLSLMAAAAGSGAVMFGSALGLTMLLNEYHALKHGRGSGFLAMVQGLVNGETNSSSEIMTALTRETCEALEHGLTSPYVQELCADPVFIVLCLLTSGTCTLALYYVSAASIHREFYVKRRHEAHLWKCQPKKFPSEALFREEMLSGCFNGFLSGVLGTSLFLWHQNWPFMKLYYTTGVRGLGHYVLGCAMVYIWIEFCSYWIHRTIHHKYIYKYIHKWHHRYKQPTAFGAYAMHPIEYITYQTAGIWFCAVFPVHLMSFLSAAIFIAYHSQVDHSGIDFDGDLPWVPSTAFHDNHHEYFHLNYGATVVLWDWIFGTLRQDDRKYAEHLFEGEQDILPSASRSLAAAAASDKDTADDGPSCVSLAAGKSKTQ